MPNQTGQVSDTDRLLALKALREYIFLHHPARYGASDFIEDIPQLRPYGMFMHDALPSAAVLDRNPDSRRLQIQQAIRKVKGLHTDHHLGKEMAYGAATMGAGSIPISLLFGGATRLFSKGRAGSWLPRYRGSDVLRNPRFQKRFTHGLGEDVADGAILGTAMGASIPLMSHQLNPSDQALQQAGNILQKAPYTSGLPGADVMASVDYNKNNTPAQTTVKNVGMGAALGAGAGATGGILQSGTTAARTALQRAFGSRVPQARISAGKIGKPSLIGAGVGAGIGLLTSALLPDQY